MPFVSGPRVQSEYSFCSAVTGWTAWARRIVCAPGFGQAEMLHLAFRDQLPDRAGHILDRHVGIDPVLVEQIDDFDAEPLQRGVGNSRGYARAGCSCPALAVLDAEAELGGDHHLVADRPQRLADNLLIGEGTVDLGRVEEGHAPIDGLHG